MKNTFIAAMFIFWGFIVAVISAGYVVKQNRLAQESMQQTYTESLKQITTRTASSNSGTIVIAPSRETSVPQKVTVPVTVVTKPVVTKPVTVVTVPKPTPTPIKTPTVPAGITMSDVAAHSTQSDCWIVINGNVYSVASYIPMHPGGARRIANMCGGDATSGYDRQGHSSYADSLLGSYLVGALQ